MPKAIAAVATLNTAKQFALDNVVQGAKELQNLRNGTWLPSDGVVVKLKNSLVPITGDTRLAVVLFEEAIIDEFLRRHGHG